MAPQLQAVFDGVNQYADIAAFSMPSRPSKARKQLAELTVVFTDDGIGHFSDPPVTYGVVPNESPAGSQVVFAVGKISSDPGGHQGDLNRPGRPAMSWHGHRFLAKDRATKSATGDGSSMVMGTKPYNRARPRAAKLQRPERQKASAGLR